MTQDLPTVAHAYTEAVIPPTCEAEGYTRYTCACGYTYDTAHVPPTGHSVQEEVVLPTCEAEGYTHYTCACGYGYKAAFLPPTGHTLSETVIPPTCTEEGYTRYTCACSYGFEGAHIPPTGHGYAVTETVLPTCTEGGYTRYVCGACAHEQTGDAVPPLNHAHSASERIYPTLSHDGYTRHTCLDCGYVFEDSYISYHSVYAGAYVDNTEILMQGIDTSKWNHEYGTSLEDVKSLNFEALKAAGVDFVILKAGSTLGIDPTFDMDYREAKAAGLQVGAYFYTYATTVEETLADAERLLSWLGGKQLELPIYFDAEDPTLMELGQERLMALCTTFVERLQEAGYYAALYTNTEWLYNLLDTQWVKEHLDVWYARYSVSLPDGQTGFAITDGDFPWKDGTAYKPGETELRFGLWQYTDQGIIEGYRYHFDFNYAFKDYAYIMKLWGLNGFSTDSAASEAL